MSNDAKNAARWRYFRNTLLAGAKRSELPEPLAEMFASDKLDSKYPNAREIDAALDELMERESRG